ncbi:NAD(P)-binding protein [Mycena venus]|uniref:NAD(P)-binding protein n=1 Tax=Mycena venus TaxID=2733690 RepID=A0A8H6XT02_9AGAR|nr:NAD(P)-binding protein [Mycena venus]
MAHPHFLLNTRILTIGGFSGLAFGVASAALSSGSKSHITLLDTDGLPLDFPFNTGNDIQDKYHDSDLHLHSPLSMAHPNFLLNTRTLIIGGSSGIGFAVASAALSSGSKAHITSVTAEKLSTKITQLQALYPAAHVSGSTADLADTDTLEANLQSVLDAAVKDTGGPLDHIVYTAHEGMSNAAKSNAKLVEITATKALSTFTARLLGPLLIGKLVAANPGRYLKPAASSSPHTHLGNLRPPPTSGSLHLWRVAPELAPIRVNVIIPGAVRTELLDEISGGNPDMFTKGTLTKEVGSAEGAAEAYLFSMRSALATGQGFIIDNGTMMA